MSRNTILTICLFASALLLASCGSVRHSSTTHSPSPEMQSGRPVAPMQPSTLHPLSKSLINEANKWLGTPYKYGGNDRSGVDCSGLVVRVFLDALDIKLPRSSNDIASYCTGLNLAELIPGDLLFFKTTSADKVSHVGIYIGDNQMIHASTRGVVVSDIMSDYYRRTFANAGCVDHYRHMISSAPMPKSKSQKVKSSENSKHTDSHKKTETTKPHEPKVTIKAVSEHESQPNSSLTEEEARRAVLSKLIEQKIDSIFAK